MIETIFFSKKRKTSREKVVTDPFQVRNNEVKMLFYARKNRS